MNTIEVYDNFLNYDDFLQIRNTLISDQFPWYYKCFIDYPPNVQEYVDYSNNFQFTHMFYDKYNSVSNHTQLLVPLIEKINPSALIKIKANLLTRTDSLMKNMFHVDLNLNQSKTAVFYVNSNDGKTIFETGQEIESIENRLIVFNCDMKHTGTTCTNEKVRCVINLNYYD